MRFRNLLIIIVLVTAIDGLLRNKVWDKAFETANLSDSANCWTGAGLNQIPVDSAGLSIRYGRALISNTSYYLGPAGIVAPISNGMNCQNCHLEAGTKPWGNNYGAVASTYPKKETGAEPLKPFQKGSMIAWKEA